MIIKEPEVAKLFADKVRTEILHNLRHKEMTACQLAKLLDKNVSSISHHLSVLEKAGLIEQTRTSMKGNLVEKYYRAVAEKFIISYTLSEGLIPGSEDVSRWNREICRNAAENIGIFGFKIPEEKRPLILSLIERHAILENMILERIISNQKESVEISKPAMRLLLSVLTHAFLFRSPEYRRIIDELCKELGIEIVEQ
ncbi:MAG: winged helix-turn-helix domain-containing protein [Nitrososphaerota archaeon]|nr:winged helix-turn-helix domain-containing protein [Candidatus Bathyarchaeota archaeon]MDW8049072.1 winged helix-turn-helix domain-containing protein [Nitrososphaerota archaeon]